MPKSQSNSPSSRTLRNLLLITAVFAQLTAVASEDSGITLHPHADVATAGNIKDFGQDTAFGLGVGYQFNKNWAIEFVKQRASSTLKTAGKPDIDIDNWHVDGLYHFKGNDLFTPYASLGYGAIDYDAKGAANDDGNVYNIGVGLKHAIGKFTNLRADLRSFRSTDSVYAGTTTTLGIHHRFGSKAPAPKANPKDDDRDGVPNASDQCPNTRANTQVDPVGCVLDNDQDGVPNYADKCPATTNRSARIDQNDCYIMLNEDISISEVFYFATDSYASRTAHSPKLKKLTDFLQQNPASSVNIVGHADKRGDADYNLVLSKNRAKTIADALLQKSQIDDSRVILNSYGEAQPTEQGNAATAHAANRRVTVAITATKKSIALK